MIIGVDFDNTIVCYDRLFHGVALRRGLIPEGVPAAKEAVRDYLRRAGGERAWIGLQGRVYGPEMRRAPAFPGALAFLRRCRFLGIPVRIISHRTRRPFAGPLYDLHRWARLWLRRHGVFDRRRLGLRPGDVRLLPTKAAKLAAIRRHGCTHFVDDLPEFLRHPDFPSGVRRILFDPQCGAARRGPWRRVGGWREAQAALLPKDKATAGLFLAADALLKKAGLPGAAALEPLAGAANNRVFRVSSGDGELLLKSYFRHPGDARDRCATEFAFCRRAWELGLRCVPRAVIRDSRRSLALYEFVAGRRLRAGEVGADSVRQAVSFWRGLNAARLGGRRCPEASDAGFSTAEHLAAVARRLARLQGLPAACDLDRQAREFARKELGEAWRRISAFVRERSRRLGLELDARLPRREWRLSPSDFGFHNAILERGGRLRFVDFEYAGWDDPAKTVCDFFCQQAVPVPAGYGPMFMRGVLGDLPRSRLHRERVAMLMPVQRLKWCCILLNEFLPVGLARRRFSGSQAQKAAQLRKARVWLRGLWRPWPEGGMGKGGGHGIR
ncbi:MAG: aminoglycoside phosphotransferase family protein [Elusimicrobia bacterium]|nr:aminoglycoside phosphotransferase family protein [Elusimicrobiota bacterium]